jgi:hypothetical protein
MSNYTKTTNFLAKDSLPDADTAKIIRGSEFDTEFNNLVTAVASKANTISPTLTGVPITPTAAAGTSTLQIASTAFVQTAATAAFPSGGIIMWSGSIATIPLGWLLCNGTGSTPDLRNRFILGAGDTYAVAATGGSADAVVVSHTHSITVSDPGHKHKIASSGDFNSGDFLAQLYSPGSGSNSYTLASKSGAANVYDSSLVTTGISVTANSTGEAGTNKNLPPYYALAYIMKS